MSFDTNQTLLSQEEFIAMKETLKDKSVNFSTAGLSFRGRLEDVYNIGGGVISVSVIAPESRKRFTADPWIRRPEKILTVSLSEYDKIWKTGDGSRVYVAFLDTCNMTIG